jgi:hypothetical protein
VDFSAEELLLKEDFSSTLKMAELFCFLLRYRALPGEPAPRQWYGGLQGVRSGRDPVKLPQEVLADPFHGLPKY